MCSLNLRVATTVKINNVCSLTLIQRYGFILFSQNKTIIILYGKICFISFYKLCGLTFCHSSKITLGNLPYSITLAKFFLRVAGILSNYQEIYILCHTRQIIAAVGQDISHGVLSLCTQSTGNGEGKTLQTARALFFFRTVCVVAKEQSGKKRFLHKGKQIEQRIQRLSLSICKSLYSCLQM